MIKEHFVVYIDILGFNSLPSELSQISGFDEDVIRDTFLTKPVRETIHNLQRLSDIQVTKGISAIEGSDNYVLLLNNLEAVFEVIAFLTAIKLPHSKYQYIPLEMAVGSINLDVDKQIDLINRKEIIAFLKNDIISPFRRYYKDAFSVRLKKSFLLLTESVYEKLDSIEKRYCDHVLVSDKRLNIAPLERFQGRGRVFAFLRKLGIPNDKWYARINDIYVSPTEYEEISKTLKAKRIAFITGSPEYGKTYTAIRLLWEYFNKGFEPRWIRGGDQLERVEVRGKLENIEAVLKPNHIIYFEDPFGIFRYEKRERIEREINEIIDIVRQTSDTYIIITSREEMFKRFLDENIAGKALEKFQIKLGLSKPSYDYGKRIEILSKWGEERGCKWIGQEKLLKSIEDSMRDEKILPTILSIKNFCISTVNIEDESLLKICLTDKSNDTAKEFAKEMTHMTDDKLVFLSFIHIGYSETSVIKQFYQEIVDQLCLNDAWTLERIIDWFKNDKIIHSGQYIIFSHDSYLETLDYLLIDNGHLSRFNKHIFHKVLLKLSKDVRAAFFVARTIGDNYSSLTDEVKDLLFKMAKNVITARGVVWAIANNFEELPNNIQNLLFTLSSNEAVAGVVARAVTDNFNTVSAEAKALLFQFVENKDIVGYVLRGIIDNYNELPNEVKDLLFKYHRHVPASRHVAHAIIKNFDKLPEEAHELLFNLLEDRNGRAKIAKSVVRYFNELPSEFVERILRKIASFADLSAIGYVAHVITSYYSSATSNMRSLLFELAENANTGSAIGQSIVKHWDSLPADVRGLLFKFAEHETLARSIAGPIAEHYATMPDDARRLLLKISTKKKAYGKVARAVARHYDRLPFVIQNILFQYVETEAAKALPSAVAEHYDQLPEDVRRLLFRLSTSERAAGAVANAIVKYYDRLPGEVRQLLFQLIKNEKSVYSTVSAIIIHFSKLPEEVRSLLLKCVGSAKSERVLTKVLKKHPTNIPQSYIDKFPEHIKVKILNASGAS